ncbi:MAG: hypothetical protein SGARI_008298 [Bacillariaceae sp.]
MGVAAMSMLAGTPITAAHADEIKTLDMSLPSYGAINTLKSGADTDKGMGVEAPIEPVGKKAKPAKKKAASGGGGGGGNPLGNVLPSMNKSVGKKPRNTETASAERPAKRVKEEKEEDEIKTMDLSLPSYSEGTQAKDKSAFSL